MLFLFCFPFRLQTSDYTVYKTELLTLSVFQFCTHSLSRERKQHIYIHEQSQTLCAFSVLLFCIVIFINAQTDALKIRLRSPRTHTSEKQQLFRYYSSSYYCRLPGAVLLHESVKIIFLMEMLTIFKMFM